MKKIFASLSVMMLVLALLSLNFKTNETHENQKLQTDSLANSTFQFERDTLILEMGSEKWVDIEIPVKNVSGRNNVILKSGLQGASSDHINSFETSFELGSINHSMIDIDAVADTLILLYQESGTYYLSKYAISVQKEVFRIPLDYEPKNVVTTAHTIWISSGYSGFIYDRNGTLLRNVSGISENCFFDGEYVWAAPNYFAEYSTSEGIAIAFTEFGEKQFQKTYNVWPCCGKGDGPNVNGSVYSKGRLYNLVGYNQNSYGIYTVEFNKDTTFDVEDKFNFSEAKRMKIAHLGRYFIISDEVDGLTTFRAVELDNLNNYAFLKAEDNISTSDNDETILKVRFFPEGLTSGEYISYLEVWERKQTDTLRLPIKLKVKTLDSLSLWSDNISIEEIAVGQYFEKSLFFQNTGSSVLNLSYSLSNSDFNVNQSSGSLVPQEISEIKISITPSEAKDYFDTLYIQGSGINLKVPVSAGLNSRSKLHLSVDTLGITVKENYQSVSSFDISNLSGKSDLSWSIDNIPSWLSLSPSSGIIGTNFKQRVNVDVQTFGLSAGLHTALLNINTNISGDSLVQLPVKVNVDEIYDLSLENDTLFYPDLFILDTTQLSFKVVNTGNVPMSIDSVVFPVSSQEAFSLITTDITTIIDPTDSLEIKFLFYPKTNFNGQKVQVIYNDSLDSPLRLTLMGPSTWLKVMVDSLSIELENGELKSSEIPVRNVSTRNGVNVRAEFDGVERINQSSYDTSFVFGSIRHKVIDLGAKSDTLLLLYEDNNQYYYSKFCISQQQEVSRLRLDYQPVSITYAGENVWIVDNASVCRLYNSSNNEVKSIEMTHNQIVSKGNYVINVPDSFGDFFDDYIVGTYVYDLDGNLISSGEINANVGEYDAKSYEYWNNQLYALVQSQNNQNVYAVFQSNDENIIRVKSKVFLANTSATEDKNYSLSRLGRYFILSSFEDNKTIFSAVEIHDIHNYEKLVDNKLYLLLNETGFYNANFSGGVLPAGEYKSDFKVYQESGTDTLHLPVNVKVKASSSVEVLNKAIDFGFVELGNAKSRRLFIQNNGNVDEQATISIKNGNFGISKSQIELAPFEIGFLDVKFNPSQIASLSDSITISFDNNQINDVVVKVEGKSEEPPKLTLSDSVLNYSVNFGDDLNDSIQFSNLDGSSILEWSIAFNDEWIRSDSTYGMIAVGQSANIPLFIDVSALNSGNYYTEITVTTNDPANASFFLPVHLVVDNKAILTSSDTIMYSDVIIGDTVEFNFQIENLGDTVAIIDSIVFASDEFKLLNQPSTIDPFSEFEVKFQFSPTEPHEIDEILIFSQSSSNSPLKVYFKGTTQGSPVLGIPQSITRRIAKGSIDTIYLDIDNTSGASMLNWSVVPETFSDGGALSFDVESNRLLSSGYLRYVSVYQDTVYVIEKYGSIYSFTFNGSVPLEIIDISTYESVFGLTVFAGKLFTVNNDGYVTAQDFNGNRIAYQKLNGTILANNGENLLTLTNNSLSFYTPNLEFVKSVERKEPTQIKSFTFDNGYYFAYCFDPLIGNYYIKMMDIIDDEFVSLFEFESPVQIDAHISAENGKIYLKPAWDTSLIYRMDNILLNNWVYPIQYSGSVEAGSSFSLPVVLNTNLATEVINTGALNFTSNDPFNKLASIDVELEVFEVHIEADKTILDFGEQWVTDTTWQEVKLKNVGQDEIEILSIEHSSDFLLKSYDNNIASGAELVLELGLTSNSVKSIDENILISTADDQLSIHVNGSVILPSLSFKTNSYVVIDTLGVGTVIDTLEIVESSDHRFSFELKDSLSSFELTQEGVLTVGKSLEESTQNTYEVLVVLGDEEVTLNILIDILSEVLASEVDDLIKIYPNPVVSDLNIRCGSVVKQVSVFDLSGRVQFIQQVFSRDVVLDMSNLSSGVYTLELETDDGRIERKILVK